MPRLTATATEAKGSSPFVHHGDCLDGIEKAVEALGPFDLIYVDPPYNAGGTRSKRETQGERISGTLAYKDAWGGLDGFLQMFRPRLEQMHNALSERGSLWIHLDYRTVHNVKVMADDVFGRPGYQGEIACDPGNGGRKRSGLSVTHHTILIYSKSPKRLYNIEDPSLREPIAETT
jgi:site-specific DNA-methyltransferase (adenine-specific)